MKFKSTILASASGSVNGATFSRNRGGPYIRTRSIPINPNTAQQAAQRAIFSELIAGWQALSVSQRQAWDDYANANPQTDRLGDPRNIGGQGMYIRSNSLRKLLGLTLVTAAPTANGPIVLTAPVIASVNASADTCSVTFTNTDSWATAVGGGLAIFMSRPQPTTINGFKGPFRYADKVLGAATPPTSPKTVTLPFPVATGQRIFGRFIATGTDGRISNEIITFQVAS